EGVGVADVRDEGSRVTVHLEDGDTLTADAVVLATGAELSRLARKFGVRVWVQAGRGCSFSIPMHRGPAGPEYFAIPHAAFTRLARKFGVRVWVQAGRGYSFSIPMRRVPAGPVYFPVQRVACTPLGDRLRVAGMMEFRRHGEPLDPRRIQAIVKAAAPLLDGAD